MSQISISSDSGDEFVVEQILDRRQHKGRMEYLIKWQGFENQNTWEPLANLKYVQNMVVEFDKKYDQETAKPVEQPSEKKRRESESPKPKKKTKKNSPTRSSGDEKRRVEGSYEENDSAREIMNIRKDTERKVLEFYVTWKPRKNQKTP